MRAKRMEEIPGFGIDRVAAAVGEDPDVLRLENLLGQLEQRFLVHLGR